MEVVSACDPLNLVGIATPGERVPSLPGNRVVFRDGVPVASLEKGIVVNRSNADAVNHGRRRESPLRPHPVGPDGTGSPAGISPRDCPTGLAAVGTAGAGTRTRRPFQPELSLTHTRFAARECQKQDLRD